MRGTQRIGYARVSTSDQNLDLQAKALEAAGCAAIFRDDGVSGSLGSRPGLTEALAALRGGGVLVVWKLDRLGRSLGHLIRLLEDLGDSGIGFVSLTEAIDTTTSGGRLMFHLLAALAEFERSLIAERTRAGMAAARQRGAAIGRPRKLSANQLTDLRGVAHEGRVNLSALACRYGVSESTIRRALASSKC
jgi:DNA invertase Pin-like site-specific DNA recombinase